MSEAEVGVIGSLLIDADKVLGICHDNDINEESFTNIFHRRVWRVINELINANKPVDVITVTDALDMDKNEASLGIEEILDSTPTAAHAEHYAELFASECSKKRIKEMCDEAEILINRGASVQTLISTIEETVGDVAGAGHKQTLGETCKKVANEIIDESTGKKKVSISTGLTTIDYSLGKLRPEYIILAARPSMGKTSLAMNIAEHIEKTNGHVLIYSLEMSRDALIERQVLREAGITRMDVENQMVSDNQLKAIHETGEKLSEQRFIIDDQASLDIDVMRSRGRSYARRYDVKLVIVDYLQLVTCERIRSGNANAYISAISAGLKAMQKELKCPVLVLSQLSRKCEERDEGKPLLSDLRDSGSLEQDADRVWFLRRPSRIPQSCEYDLGDGRAYLDQAKMRGGRCNEIVLQFLEEKVTFKEMDEI